MKGYRLVFPICFLLLMLNGCTRDVYIVELRNANTKQSLVGARVILISVPRIYSFIDPRHYSPGSGQSVMKNGVTNATGTVELDLPHNLDSWRIVVDDTWILRGPTPNWSIMTLCDEQKPDQNDALLEGRPEVRILKK